MSSSMWVNLLGKTLQIGDRRRPLLICQQCVLNREVFVTSSYLYNKHPHQHSLVQVRQYSDGRKGFFQSIYDNVREGLASDKSLNENLKKFREEKKKLESSDAIKQARKKFESIESETSKGTDTFKKGFDDVKGKFSETLEEVQKSEYVKKGMEFTSEFSKTAGKASETILEQGKRIGQSSPMKTVSEGVRAVKEELDEVSVSKNRPYKPPEKLLMRSDRRQVIFEPDNESIGMVVHKNSKWHASWTDFKDNNVYVNKVFDLKMKYDESDNVMIRGTRFITDRISSLFGGMFSTTELSEVLTEVCKMDPDFEKERFLLWCQYHVVPNILEALVQGEQEILEDWCYEAPFNVLIQPIKTAKTQGLRFDSKILDVSNVDLAAGKMMDQGPVLVITFNSQQIMVVRNSKGEVVEGDPDKITLMTYVWALCRDMEEINPEAAWKLLDISAHSQEHWL